MAEIFPGVLQELVNTAGFNHGIGETIVRSQMDIGPAKVRRRFTKGIDTFSCSIDMDYDNYQTLYDFYNTTLNGGANNFLYDHPMTGDEEEFRFINAPSMTPLGGRYFRVQMQWELMS